MAVAAISTSRLTKDYGAGRGLFDLDLHVAQQEVIGYLGPNGSGKTTTIRLLMGMIRPSSGSAHIFGLDCVRDSVEVKRKVGYLPGDIPQFGSLRGSEVVAYLGGMRGGVDRRHVRAIAERFDLDLNRRFREYSSGNKQKLAIVLAFVGHERDETHRDHRLGPAFAEAHQLLAVVVADGAYEGGAGRQLLHQLGRRAAGRASRAPVRGQRPASRLSGG